MRSKKVLRILTVILCLFVLIGCSKKEDGTIDSNFREEYEYLNGKETSNGNTYFEVDLSNAKKNAIREIGIGRVVNKIQNGESFFLYIGDEMCPWCRSVIETAINSFNASNVDLLYYLQIWDDDHNEIFRDVIKIENEEQIVTKEPDFYYPLLIEALEDAATEYTLTDENGEKIGLGENRIYVPLFVHIKDGVLYDYITGVSHYQTEPYAELTPEALAEQKELFDSFFVK